MLPEQLVLFLDAINLEKILLLIIGIAFVIGLAKSLKWVVHHLCDLFPSRKRIWLQIYTILSFPVFLMSILFVVYKGISLPQEIVLAFIGSSTFAIGFALKDFEGSIISGWSIALDSPFQIGDTIKFRNLEGVVIHVGLRVVKIQTADDEIVTIPNVAFLSDAVLCRNLGVPYLKATNLFYVDAKANTKLVRELILQAIHLNNFAHHEIQPIITFKNVWKADMLCIEVVVRSNVVHNDFESRYSSILVETVNKKLHEHNIYIPCKLNDYQRIVSA